VAATGIAAQASAAMVEIQAVEQIRDRAEDFRVFGTFGNRLERGRESPLINASYLP
jgi:hypothetical protein